MDRTNVYSGDKRGWYQETSVKTANFKTRQAANDLPNNPYFWMRIDGMSRSVATYNGNRNDWDAASVPALLDWLELGQDPGDYFGKTLSQNNVANLEAIAVNRLLAQLRDNSFELGVSLAELGQTAEFVNGACKRTALFYTHLRKGKVKRAFQEAGFLPKKGHKLRDTAGNAWLEHSYAVRPLLADVHGAAKLLESGIERETGDFVISGYAHKVFDDSGKVKVGFPFNGNRSIHMTAKASVRCACVARVTNPGLVALDALGLYNPLTVAWEKVPFSFVVDWFLPVGAFFETLVPPAGVDFIRGYKYTKLRGLGFRQTDYTTPAPGWKTSLQWREVYKKRVTLGGFPSYRYQQPDYSLSKSQVASGIALLMQTLGR